MWQARREREAEQQRVSELVDALSAARKCAQAENARRTEMHGVQQSTEDAPAFSEVLYLSFQRASALIIC